MFKWCCLCPLCLPFNDWSKKVRKLSIISLSLRLMTVFRFMIREDVFFLKGFWRQSSSLFFALL